MTREELMDKLKFEVVDNEIKELMIQYENRQINKKCGERTIIEENKNMNRFFKYLSKIRRVKTIKLNHLRELKGMHFQDYVDWLSEDQEDRAGYKNASIQKFITNVSSFINHLVKYGHMDFNPISKNIDYPFEQKVKKYFSQEEGKAVIDAMMESKRGRPYQNKAIAMLMFFEALRIEEIANFKIENYLNFKSEGLIKVLGKGRGSKKQRVITLFKDVEKAIDEYLASGERREGSEYLFTTDRFKTSGDNISVSHIRNIVNDAREITGYSDITPHKYRKLLVERLMDAGVDIEMASKILGHSSIDITRKHYLQMKESSKMKDLRNVF